MGFLLCDIERWSGPLKKQNVTRSLIVWAMLTNEKTYHIGDGGRGGGGAGGERVLLTE